MREQKFWHAVLPSMLSQLLIGFFIIVDGFFIGGAMGDAGLAAINVAWPIVGLIMSVGMGLGTGGAILAATARGRADDDAVRVAQGNTLAALAVASAVLTVGLLACYRPLLPLLGAVGDLYPMAEEYTRMVVLLATATVFADGLTPLLRGSGRPVEAMAVMVTGLVLNIFLDWLFVWKLALGMAGAAVATILAQLAGIPLALFFLLRDKARRPKAADLVPRAALLRRMAALGAAPFALSMSASAVIWVNNLQALRYGGAGAVAVYAVISYVFGSLHPLLSGVSEGVQPLVSFSHGARDGARLGRLRRASFGAVLAVAAVLAAATWAARGVLPQVFGASGQTVRDSAGALVWTCLALPVYGVARVCCGYFSAVGRARQSNLLAFAEPLLVQPLFLLVLPLFFGVDGIWMASPAGYLVLAAAGLALLRGQIRHERESGLAGGAEKPI